MQNKKVVCGLCTIGIVFFILIVASFVPALAASSNLSNANTDTPTDTPIPPTPTPSLEDTAKQAAQWGTVGSQEIEATTTKDGVLVFTKIIDLEWPQVPLDVLSLMYKRLCG